MWGASRKHKLSLVDEEGPVMPAVKAKLKQKQEELDRLRVELKNLRKQPPLRSHPVFVPKANTVRGGQTNYAAEH
jgi:hypothetical protein